jgi:hypothetical protein
MTYELGFRIQLNWRARFLGTWCCVFLRFVHILFCIRTLCPYDEKVASNDHGKAEEWRKTVYLTSHELPLYIIAAPEAQCVAGRDITNLR